MTELVSRAAQAGLVSVTQSSSDGRVSEIRLSAKGARHLAECFSRLEDERRALGQALSARETQTVS